MKQPKQILKTLGEIEAASATDMAIIAKLAGVGSSVLKEFSLGQACAVVLQACYKKTSAKHTRKTYASIAVKAVNAMGVFSELPDTYNTMLEAGASEAPPVALKAKGPPVAPTQPAEPVLKKQKKE